MRNFWNQQVEEKKNTQAEKMSCGKELNNEGL